MKTTSLILCLLMLTGAALAQRQYTQTQPQNQTQSQPQTGNYPLRNQGSTFTGYVVGRDAGADTITLEGKANNKVETVTVSLVGGCQEQDVAAMTMHAADIPQGAKLKVNYMAVATRGGVSQQTPYRAIGFEFVQSQSGSNTNKPYYACGMTASRAVK